MRGRSRGSEPRESARVPVNEKRCIAARDLLPMVNRCAGVPGSRGRTGGYRRAAARDSSGGRSDADPASPAVDEPGSFWRHAAARRLFRVSTRALHRLPRIPDARREHVFHRADGSPSAKEPALVARREWLASRPADRDEKRLIRATSGRETSGNNPLLLGAESSLQCVACVRPGLSR